MAAFPFNSPLSLQFDTEQPFAKILSHRLSLRFIHPIPPLFASLPDNSRNSASISFDVSHTTILAWVDLCLEHNVLVARPASKQLDSNVALFIGSLCGACPLVVHVCRLEPLEHLSKVGSGNENVP